MLPHGLLLEAREFGGYWGADFALFRLLASRDDAVEGKAALRRAPS